MGSGEQAWRAADGSDPFRHHPDLRALITPPGDSFFRGFQPASLDEQMAQMGRPPDWRYPDDIREAEFHAFLDQHGARDLWVFAYGSLMWDPAVYFDELRHAFVPDCARRFILWTEGGRGTPDRPAVMAALDKGNGCHGLALRIAGERLSEELGHIWRRERIAPAYVSQMVTAQTDQGDIQALTFLADHSAEAIRPDLTRDQQVEALASAEGVLGTNIAYIDNLKHHFDQMGIADAEMDMLHRMAHARRNQIDGATQ